MNCPAGKCRYPATCADAGECRSDDDDEPSALDSLRELAGEGSTVLLSSWVYQGDVTGWRVMARGMDGWRKCGDGRTLEAAIAAASAADWHSPSTQPDAQESPL